MSPARKPAAKKAATRKAAAKKAATKPPITRKPAATKPAATKPAGKKAPARKAAATNVASAQAPAPGSQAASNAAALAPRAPGERRYWLVKSEPGVFAFDDLLAAPDATTCWDGVRNFLARNFMRDGMRVGDGVLFYHSNAEPPAIVGTAEVVREAYPDETAFDAGDPYFDPKSRREAPTWMMVDLRARHRLTRPLSLEALRAVPALAGLELLRTGNRLSVQPVSAEHWAIVTRLGGLDGA